MGNRSSGAATALAAVLMSCAPAMAAVCAPDPSVGLSATERELRRTISERRRLGLPSARAHVRRVNADRANRRRKQARSFALPLSRREAAYMAQYARLLDALFTGRLKAYARRHDGQLGALSIRNDYPRGPYMLVRVTRDVARHRAAIAQLFTLPFRIKQVAYSSRALDRIRRSIAADDEQLRADGIDVIGSRVKPEHVVIDVVTARDDVRAVIRRRYGPAVRVDVLGPAPTRPACQQPGTYRADADGRTLHVAYTADSTVTPREVEVVETTTGVAIGIAADVPWDLLTTTAKIHTLTVTLVAPLADRVVKYIVTGEPVYRVAAAAPPAVCTGAASTFRVRCHTPAMYKHDSGGPTLYLTYVDSGSATPRGVEVVETETDVRLGVVTETPSRATADAATYTVGVTLERPLGERQVTSVRTGQPITPSP